MWLFNKTSEFVKCSEKLGISEETHIAIENWVTSVGRIETGRQKIIFRSPRNSFEIWIARIPDPESNKGKSGGFRLVYILNLKENAVYVDKMEKRSSMGFGDERPRDKQKFQEYISELKIYLLKIIENGDR